MPGLRRSRASTLGPPAIPTFAGEGRQGFGCLMPEQPRPAQASVPRFGAEPQPLVGLEGGVGSRHHKLQRPLLEASLDGLALFVVEHEFRLNSSSAHYDVWPPRLGFL